jgi:hypothetical protein
MRSSHFQFVFYLAILLTLAGCGQSTSTGGGNSSSTPSPCEKSSSIKGQIVTISHNASGNRLGGFLLDGSKEQNATYDKVYVMVPDTTQIYTNQQGQCHTIPFTALTSGQRVQIQSTGPVAQSYPPQIQADEILLLP